MVSVFRETLEFFDRLGVFDVILPFLLVFTIVFAILEKTRLFGVDKIEGREYTKKGLNSIVGFAISLLFVASTQLVGVMMGIVAKFVMLLLLPILFLVLVGAFHTGQEEFKLNKSWQTIFYIILFIGILMVFTGQLGWLNIAYEWVFLNWDTTIFSSFIFLAIMVGGIYLVVHEPKQQEKSKD